MLLAARFLLSLTLVSAAGAKLYLESPSNDDRHAGWAHPVVTDSNTLSARAYQRMDEGPSQDLANAQRILEQLLATNAASAEQWWSLGAVLAKTGQMEKGRYCYLRAAELAPNSVEAQLAVASFYINAGEGRSALPYLGKILDRTGLYDDTVFNYLDALKLDFNQIAAHSGVSAQSRGAQSYFRHLLSTGDVDNARKAWHWLNPASADAKLADDYVTFLANKGLADEAAQTWDTKWGESQTALLHNGEFERDPSAAFFDWRISSRQHVGVSRDEMVFHAGRSSLRIQFDGQENLDYAGISQRVFLQPGAYRLSAFVRTQDITTDQGVALRILNVETEKVTGTVDWKQLEAAVVVPFPARIVEIQMVRHPSLRFDSKIAGTAWIDSVTLRRVRY